MKFSGPTLKMATWSSQKSDSKGYREVKLGSLSNQKGDKNVTNLHISSSFARFARAYAIFVHFAVVLVLSTT